MQHNHMRPSQEQLQDWLESSLNNWGKWGADDEKGTLNYLTEERSAEALAMVQDGKTVSCARNITYEALPEPNREPVHYMLSTGDRYRKGEGPYRQVAVDFFGLVFHGFTVTHIDSLAHFFWDGKMYNGRSSCDVTVDEGAKHCAVIEAKGGIIGKGVLVDVPMLRGTEFVERGDGVGIADIKASEKECGISFSPGSIALLRTGQLGKMDREGVVDPRKEGAAGPLPEILPMIQENQVAVLGSDTGNDVTPSGYEKFSNPVHQVGIVGMGLWILDNAWLDDLAEECKRRGQWEFAMVISPLAIPNATGSPVNPLAIF